MKYKCVQKCYYKRRLYTVGMTVEIPANEPVPKHFKDAAKVTEAEKLSEPKTFSELHREEAAKALKAVGHYREAKKFETPVLIKGKVQKLAKDANVLD